MLGTRCVEGVFWNYYYSNHKYYNFLESDLSINPPIRALVGHVRVLTSP